MCLYSPRDVDIRIKTSFTAKRRGAISQLRHWQNEMEDCKKTKFSKLKTFN